VVLPAIAVFLVNPAKACRLKGVLPGQGVLREMLAGALAVPGRRHRQRGAAPARRPKVLGAVLRKSIVFPVRHQLNRGAHSACCFGRRALRM